MLVAEVEAKGLGATPVEGQRLQYSAANDAGEVESTVTWVGLVILVVSASALLSIAQLRDPGAEANERYPLVRYNGQPIAARIKHKYVFTPPPARLVGKVTSQLRDTPLSGATITVASISGARQSASAIGEERDPGAITAPESGAKYAQATKATMRPPISSRPTRTGSASSRSICSRSTGPW